MKKLSVLIFLIFSISIINAQFKFGDNFYIGFSGSASFPMNDFGDDNPANNASGYATLGPKFELSAGLRILNILDLSFMGFVNLNGTNFDNFVSAANSNNPGLAFSAESKSWVIYGGLGGFSISYPVPGGFFVDARVLGGVIKIESPEILLNSAVNNSFLRVGEKSTSSFVYLTSAGIRYPLNENFHLITGIEYIGSSPRFEDVKTVTSINGNETISTTSFDQTMDILNVTVGIKFFLFGY